MQLPTQLQTPFALHICPDGHEPHDLPHPSVPHTLPVQVHASQTPDVGLQT